jgi:hypothetical protein
MASEKPEGPQPFVPKEQRPDLSIDLNQKVGEMTVRDLATLLGGGSSAVKLKEALKEKETAIEKGVIKDNLKDIKDTKDHKEPKDRKEQKDNKDHKDQKDPKDIKDHKDPKDAKDQKDTKDHKDPKDPKEQKDQKDAKDHKDQADHKAEKDHKDLKDGAIEKIPTKDAIDKVQPDKTPLDAPPTGPGDPGTGLGGVIQRKSGLEPEPGPAKGPGQGKGPSPS